MSYEDCIIIGGGAAGLLAAAMLQLPDGRSGRILEATGQPGTKLRMSGGGHCNFTHSGPIRDFPACYGDAGRSIRKLLYRHNNENFVRFLANHGVPSVTQADGRVFPESMRADDVLQALLYLAAENHFGLVRSTRVTSIEPGDSGNDCILRTSSGETFAAHTVIIATGGKSYPSTGSNGQFWDALHKGTGIRIAAARPALAPIHVEQYPYSDLAGLSFEHALLTVTAPGRKIQSRAGSLLLTHREFSGPAALNLSVIAEPGTTLHVRYIDGKYGDTAAIAASLQPELNRAGADASSIIERDFSLPKRFARKLVQRAGVSPKRLAALLTDDCFTVSGLPDWNRAMVTRGGIDRSEIDFRTMALKSYPGIYAIGEAVDVDGLTGGYNLQFAYSSAAAAAEAVLSKLTGAEE